MEFSWAITSFILLVWVVLALRSGARKRRDLLSRECRKCGRENLQEAKFCGDCGEVLRNELAGDSPYEAYVIQPGLTAAIRTCDGTLLISPDLYHWTTQCGQELSHERRIELGNFYKAAMLFGKLAVMKSGSLTGERIRVSIDEHRDNS